MSYADTSCSPEERQKRAELRREIEGLSLTPGASALTDEERRAMHRAARKGRARTNKNGLPSKTRLATDMRNSAARRVGAIVAAVEAAYAPRTESEAQTSRDITKALSAMRGSLANGDHPKFTAVMPAPEVTYVEMGSVVRRATKEEVQSIVRVKKEINKRRKKRGQPPLPETLTEEEHEVLETRRMSFYGPVVPDYARGK